MQARSSEYGEQNAFHAINMAAKLSPLRNDL